MDNQKDTWNSLPVDDPPKDGDLNSDLEYFPLEQVASVEESDKDISEK